MKINIELDVDPVELRKVVSLFQCSDWSDEQSTILRRIERSLPSELMADQLRSMRKRIAEQN